jgi:hypothetical protein
MRAEPVRWTPGTPGRLSHMTRGAAPAWLVAERRSRRPQRRTRKASGLREFAQGLPGGVYAWMFCERLSQYTGDLRKYDSFAMWQAIAA